ENNLRPELDVLRTIQQSHAASSEPIQDAVVRNGLSGQRKFRALDLRTHRGMYVVACTSITCKQCFYFLPQLGVAVASLIQQSCSALTVAFRDAMKQLLDLRPTFRSQVGPMPFGPDGKATLPPSSNRGGRL